MSLLLIQRNEPPPPLVVRNKTAVIALIKGKAPTKVKHDAEWWAQWLKDNWG